MGIGLDIPDDTACDGQCVMRNFAAGQQHTFPVGPVASHAWTICGTIRLHATRCAMAPATAFPSLCMDARMISGIQYGLTRAEYLSLRAPYLPEDRKIIFVLESPPKSGLYFYNPQGRVSEPLFRG